MTFEIKIDSQGVTVTHGADNNIYIKFANVKGALDYINTICVSEAN